jgi:hypothetical protein
MYCASGCKADFEFRVLCNPSNEHWGGYPVKLDAALLN